MNSPTKPAQNQVASLALTGPSGPVDCIRPSEPPANDAAALADSLTVLFCNDEGAIASKRWYRDADGNAACQDYDAGMFFKCERFPVSDIEGLAATLEALTTESKATVIRGELIEGIDPENVVRRKNKRSDGLPLCFEEKERRWFMLDCDKTPITGADLTTAEGCEAAALAVREKLPSELAGAACFWQLSSKAGFEPETKVHLFFWLDRAMGETELTAWGKAVNAAAGYDLIDVAVFRTVQPHFVANPVFDDGVPDPVAKRCGVLPGKTLAILPSAQKRSGISLAAEAAKMRQRSATPAEAEAGGRNNHLTSKAGAMRHIGLSQEEIEAALLVRNKEFAEPLPDDEVASVAASIANYPPGKPASLAPTSPEPVSEGDEAIDVFTTPVDRIFEHILADLDPNIKPLPTGIGTIDRITRGGLRPKAFVVMGGAPGAGKTSLAVQIAGNYLEQGVPVCMLAADESIEFLLGRLAQRHGITRDDFENGKPHAKKRFLELCASWKLLPLDCGWDGVTLEKAAAALDKRFGLGVLIVDSLQTVRAAAADGADGMKAKIDAVIGALKDAATRYGHVVIATSALARAAYRSKQQIDQIEDLAAFKESGDIEYGMKLGLVLRTPPGGGGAVDISVPKNRLGQGMPRFRLQLDPVRATFREVAAPAEPSAEAKATVKAEAQAARYRTIGKDVLWLLNRCAQKNKPAPPSMRQLYLALGTEGKGHKEEDVREVIRWLEGELAISKQGGRYQANFKSVEECRLPIAS
jgi:replicative DNA helicase